MTDDPEIEFLILADRVEVHDGKLYIMGGGWDRLTVPDFRQPIGFNMALAVLVPRSIAGRNLEVGIHLERANGSRVAPEISAMLTTNPTPDAPPGSPVRCILAGSAAWLLPGPGRYWVVATPGGTRGRSVAFSVVGPEPIASYAIPTAPTSMN